MKKSLKDLSSWFTTHSCNEVTQLTCSVLLNCYFLCFFTFNCQITKVYYILGETFILHQGMKSQLCLALKFAAASIRKKNMNPNSSSSSKKKNIYMFVILCHPVHMPIQCKLRKYRPCEIDGERGTY